MKRKLITLLALLSFSIAGQAQNVTNSAIEDYINQYKGLAISEQIRTGVPAAITLAQGIFETGGGTSELCLNAHNHFGVKCKGQWKGETYSYDDDQKDECFRKYENDRQSFMDHSNFLKNNLRYSCLFKIDPQHYRKWAEGLHECGYATNKHYASKLIEYIEQYDLEQYTVQALEDTRFVDGHGSAGADQQADLLAADNGVPALPQPGKADSKGAVAYRPDTEDIRKMESNATAQQQPVDWDTVRFYVTTYKNGLKGFYAPKGDLLLEYAIKHSIRYGKLLSMNDLPDEPLAANMFIYLEKKRKKGREKVFQVQPGMDMIQVSQATGVDLAQLRLLNHLRPGEDPVTGAWLQLQDMAQAKPALKVAGQQPEGITAVPGAPVKSPAVIKSSDDYVVLRPEDRQGRNSDQRPDTVVSSGTAEHMATQDEMSEEETGNVVEGLGHPVQAGTTGSSVADPVAVTPETQLSNLQKLRAKMNSIVYGEKQPEEASARKIGTQEKSPTGTSAKQKTETKNDHAAVTPTEKLRAYMQSVKENQSPDEDKPEYYTTLPAGQTRKNAPMANVAEQGDKVQYYTVKRGDTAYGIAKKFNISLEQLRGWNRLSKSMVVQAGEKLKVTP
ncbi:MAG TPA: glucosaminidase domain-containing protein [Edaphocola sp.]|nr:glucosaminidase domain-containing protein [Edaphocola sp.]